MKGSRGRGEGHHGGASHSVDKLRKVLEVCRQEGVLTTPTRFGDLVLAPVHAWHHASWDREPDIPGEFAYVHNPTELCVMLKQRSALSADSAAA